MKTQDRQLKAACNHLKAALQSLANVKKRKTKKRNPCSQANPRVHFPKTKRGRPPVVRSWTITRKGKPLLRFKATKPAAYSKARKLASRSNRLVLDGPK